MVQLIHSGENLDKINDILKVAQRRFGIYGLEKTTMKEIATDLGISKASLYYYYPDKEYLFKEVIHKEQDAYLIMVEQNIQVTSDPVEMLLQFVKMNLDYFKTFFNLSRLRMEELRNMKPKIADLLAEFRAKEIELVGRMLNIGVDKGVFYIQDTVAVASIFLECMRGLRSLVLHHKEFMYIEREDYNILEKRLQEFSVIFIRGLQYRSKL